MKCPDRLRLPLVFYYGHTASVYINKLMLAGLISVSVVTSHILMPTSQCIYHTISTFLA